MPLFKNRDYILDILIILYSLLGLLGLFAVSADYFYKQVYFYVFSIFLYFIIPIIPKKYLDISIWFAYFGNFIFLLILYFFGRTVRGSASWISFGFFNFQPGELSKFILLYIFSLILSLNVSRVRKALFSLILYIPVSLLVILQPDFGMFFILSLIFFSSIFISILKFKEFLLLSVALVILSLGFYGLLQDYQKTRITSFFSQSEDLLGSNYNVFQSQVALGSAGVFGKGINNNTQVKLGFLPENHTDFIFAGSTEAFGIVYALALTVVFLILVLYLGKIYIIKNENRFYLCYSFGLISAFFIQTILNIGMNLGIFPVTGLTLPFVSYGGTSLLTYFLMFSVLYTRDK